MDAPQKQKSLADEPQDLADLKDPELEKELEGDGLMPIVESIGSQTHDQNESAPQSSVPVDDRLHIKPKQSKFKRLLKSRKFWVTTGLIMVAGIIGAWFVQPARLWALNAVGMRAQVNITVQSGVAGAPPNTLKNAQVDINGTLYSSDDQGIVKAAIPYGETKITVSKTGYEPASVTNLYDVNPFFYLLGDKKVDEAAVQMTFVLKSVGGLVSFKALDWLTGGPVTTGQFSIGDNVAKPDTQGEVKLWLPPIDSSVLRIKATFDGAYNDQEFDLDLATIQQESFTFTPAGKDYFLSKRSGVMSLYSSDIDGKNVTEIVKGTGQETAATAVAVSPSAKYVVLSSSREGKRDATNTLLQKLYVVNTTSGALTVVDEGQAIGFADWSGDTLAYTVIERVPKATEPTQRLASIDLTSNKKVDLATADYFNAVRLSHSDIVYRLGFASQKPEGPNSPELRTVPIKGGTEKNLGYKITNIAQTDPTTFAYQTSDNIWHSYNANTGQVGNASAPQSLSRAFVNSPSPDRQNQLVFDKIDGKSALISRSLASNTETTLYVGPGLAGPIRWLASNVIIFRVTDALQSADYVVSIKGGDPKKITDVTAPSSSFTPAANYFPFY